MSGNMNPFLADMFGTNETIGAVADSPDQTKLAEAQLLTEMCAEEGIDIDTLPDEAIIKVAYELFGDDSAIVKEAMEDKEEEEEEDDEEEEEEEESAEEKVAEATFLGQVMAHSFVKERDILEKEAGVADSLARGGRAIASGAKRGGRAVSEGAKRGGRAASEGAKRGGRAIASGAKRGGSAVSGGAKAYGSNLKERATQGTILTRAKRLAPELGLAGALGAGGAYAATRDKKASAVDILAEQRAAAILEENGYVFESSGEEKLAAAVETRAWEMLEQNGYTE